MDYFSCGHKAQVALARLAALAPATLATMHDCLAMFAVFYVMNKEINLLFITAVLTIAGYSLTDTVVVFDRIRENLHKNLKGAMHTIFNLSINEVLSRTIVTSFTVFLASASKPCKR